MERGSVKNISGYLTRRMQGGTVLRNQRDNISFLNYLKISKRSYKGGRRRYRTIPLLRKISILISRTAVTCEFTASKGRR